MAQGQKEDGNAKDNKVRKLLLNLSVLNRFTINCYDFQDEFQCNGIISVEPIAKYLIWSLAKSGITFDEIIIIASKVAREDKAKNDPWKGYTALDVYTNRIKGYMGIGDDLVQFEEGQKLPVNEKPQTELIKSVYGDKEPQFTTVEFEN